MIERLIPDFTTALLRAVGERGASSQGWKANALSTLGY